MYLSCVSKYWLFSISKMAPSCLSHPTSPVINHDSELYSFAAFDLHIGGTRHPVLFCVWYFCQKTKINRVNLKS